MSITDADIDRFYGEYERKSGHIVGTCCECDEIIEVGNTYYTDGNKLICKGCGSNESVIDGLLVDKFDINEKLNFLGFERSDE